MVYQIFDAGMKVYYKIGGICSHKFYHNHVSFVLVSQWKF